MDLENLIKSRTQKKDVEFPITEKELCDRYEQVTTPMVNDVLREMEHQLIELPKNVSFKVGAFIEPIAVTVAVLQRDLQKKAMIYILLPEVGNVLRKQQMR